VSCKETLMFVYVIFKIFSKKFHLSRAKIEKLVAEYKDQEV